MMKISTITIQEIPAAKAKRAKILADAPAFGSPGSRLAFAHARRAAKRIAKQIYRARRAGI